MYCVSLCVNGIWEKVTIDDAFPCKKTKQGKYRPIFSFSKSSEIWHMLLEKAWAKVHGGYFNTIGGTSREALRDLTGAPTLSVRFSDSKLAPENHWQTLQEAFRKKFPTTASTHGLETFKSLIV